MCPGERGCPGGGRGLRTRPPKFGSGPSRWAESRMVSAQEPGTEGPWGRRGCGIELRLERTPGEDWGGCHGGCLSGSEGGVRWEVVLKVQGEAVTGGAPGLRVGGGAGGRGGGGRRQAEGAGACGAGWGRIAGAEMGGDPTLAVPGYGHHLHPLGHLMGPRSMRPGPCS